MDIMPSGDTLHKKNYLRSFLKEILHCNTSMFSLCLIPQGRQPTCPSSVRANTWRPNVNISSYVVEIGRRLVPDEWRTRTMGTSSGMSGLEENITQYNVRRHGKVWNLWFYSLLPSRSLATPVQSAVRMVSMELRKQINTLYKHALEYMC